MYKVFLLVVLAASTLGVQGCQSIPSTRELVSEAGLDQAKRLVKYPEYANVYISYPLERLRDWAYINVYINDVQVTQLLQGQFVNLKVTPGEHHFKVVSSTSMDFSSPYFKEMYNRVVAEFDLDLKKGGRALIGCVVEETYNNRLTGLSISPSSDCAKGGVGRYVTKDGITVCTSPYIRTTREFSLKAAGMAYTDNDTRFCKLGNNAENYFSYSPDMIKADAAIIEAPEEYDFVKVKRKDTLAYYQNFLKKYPSGKYTKQVSLIVEN